MYFLKLKWNFELSFSNCNENSKSEKGPKECRN